MSATYTWDVFCSLDGHGAYDERSPGADWGGYWGKQGPELLAHRLRQYQPEARMVLGATTLREFVQMLGDGTIVPDPWVERMINLPTTVISSTLTEPLPAPFDGPSSRVARGDAVEVVAALKERSEVPLRSHGSLSLNHALLAAGLVDRLQVTVFPVVTGRSGTAPIFGGADDFDLELLEQQTLDGRTQELVYRPTLHPRPQQG